MLIYNGVLAKTTMRQAGTAAFSIIAGCCAGESGKGKTIVVLRGGTGLCMWLGGLKRAFIPRVSTLATTSESPCMRWRSMARRDRTGAD